MEIQAEAAIRDAAISAAARYLGKLIVCTTKSLGVIEGWCGRFEYYVNGLPRDYGNTLHIQKPSLPDATPIDIRELRKVELFDTDRLSFVWEGQSE
jgi:hypothetical protein